MTIGFVPTMGALHHGHLSLVERCIKENDVAVCSIFVNPMQFNNQSDLAIYPRDFDGDCKKLKESGVDMIFAPSVVEMYPEEVKTQYDFGSLDKVMEGRFRPGHFNGVAVVVKRLFDIIEPDLAYFGEKDFQQLAIITKLEQMLSLNIRIIGCPIIREKDGLAMSSRNLLLNKEQRAEAVLINTALTTAKGKMTEYSVLEVKAMVTAMIELSPILRLEYFDIVNTNTLLPVDNWDDANNIVACIAAYAGKTRLIDNMVMKP